MCCSMTVQPVDRAIAEAILALGEFTNAPPDNFWLRSVEEDDGWRVTVRASFDGDKLNLSLNPNISMPQHHRRRSGGVYFEIAARVAEKCSASIVQHSNVGECVQDSSREKVLAVYPFEPLNWGTVCKGFQDVILGAATS